MEADRVLYALLSPLAFKMSSNKKLDPITMDEVMGINTGRNTPRLYTPKPMTKSQSE
jgi:hypothetical protein